MPRSWNALPGILDELGTKHPWSKIYVKVIYDDQGNILQLVPVGGRLGIDASSIFTGLIAPARIDRLSLSTICTDNWPFGDTLGVIDGKATVGAQDPVLRINAGSSLIDGEKIQPSTLSPQAFDFNEALTQLFLIGTNGYLQSDDYDPVAQVGFTFNKAQWAVYIATAIFAGILTGRINIAGFFTVDPTGKAKWMDPGAPASGFGVDPNGNTYWGGDNYADSPHQADAAGNVYLADNPDSKSKIQMGAVEPFCDIVTPSQAGGQFQGVGFANNLKLTPITRGSTIWYTLATGAAVSPVNAFNRINFAAAGLTIYDPTVGIDIDTSTGDKILTVVAEKFGVCSAVKSWTFTNAAGAPSVPTFNPQPGVFFNPSATLDVSIISNGTIKYTAWKTGTADPGAPSDTNGTVYTAPVHLTKGTWTLRAFSKNAVGSSAVVMGVYTVKVGTGTSSGTGTDNTGGTGGGPGGGGHSAP
jgi:hypothetical protein